MEQHITMKDYRATNIFKRLYSFILPTSRQNKYATSFSIPNSVWHKPLHFFAFGFGSGAFPYAPGTFGTLCAIPFYLLMRQFSLQTYSIFLLFFIFISMWACARVSKEIAVDDHPGMCIDEFVGFFVTMLGAPHGLGWI